MSCPCLILFKYLCSQKSICITTLFKADLKFYVILLANIWQKLTDALFTKSILTPKKLVNLSWKYKKYGNYLDSKVNQQNWTIYLGKLKVCVCIVKIPNCFLLKTNPKMNNTVTNFTTITHSNQILNKHLFIILGFLTSAQMLSFLTREMQFKTSLWIIQSL